MPDRFFRRFDDVEEPTESPCRATERVLVAHVHMTTWNTGLTSSRTRWAVRFLPQNITWTSTSRNIDLQRPTLRRLSVHECIWIKGNRSQRGIHSKTREINKRHVSSWSGNDLTR